MKLNETENGNARPDQVRISNSMHVVTKNRRSPPVVLLLVGIAILAVGLMIGVVFGDDTLGTYLGSAGHSPVSPALASETSVLTGTVTITATTSIPTVTLTVTVPVTRVTETPAPAEEATGATEEAAVTEEPTQEPATDTPTAEPEDTPTMTVAEVAEATAIGPKVATAVAATLTAMPTPTPSSTPDKMATATAEAEKIATAVVATLASLPAGSDLTLTLGPTVEPEIPVPGTVTATVTLPSAECLNDLAYMADVTIPDNTQFQPGETFTKTWRVKNTGTCTWEEGYQVLYSRHEQMGGPAAIVVSDTVAVGATFEISIPLVAPDTPGTYTGVWQVGDEQGTPFGEVLTVVIVVPGAEESADIVLPAVVPPDVEFGYGIQAHAWDGGMEPLVSAVHNIGFSWVKQQTEWKVMEPENGNYQWGNTDRIVDALTANGLKPMFSVVKSPKWSRPPDTDFAVEGPPADPQEFAEFLGAMAARYKGRVKAYEVWNEQNLHYEWGNEQLDPARYMTLLKLAYVAIKAADPDAVVISGALTPTGAPQPWAIDDLQYLEAMYENGLKDACDAIGAHPSGYNVPPEADWQTWQRSGLLFQGPVNNRHHSWSFKATMEGYRDLMLQYDDGNKTIWPTEFGWASSPLPSQNYEYAADNSLEQQAQYTVRAYQMGKDWGWVGTMFLWNLNFKVVAPGTEQAQWGIVDANWGALPVYHALAAMPK